MEDYDVAVIGAGPAGSSAARAAAAAGARVVVLDRTEFPRYKTCGGGLIGPSLAALPGTPPTRASITRVSLSLAGARRRTRVVDQPCLEMVTRAELDDWLLAQAAATGAEVRVPCRVLSVADDVVQTDAGPLRAEVVIAADGTSSRLAREVGVRLSRVDLGLELELDAGSSAAAWADRVHLDWGPVPGSYGWVFPKGDTLTVGVIGSRDEGRRCATTTAPSSRRSGSTCRPLRRRRAPDPGPRPGLPAAARRGAGGRRRRRPARAMDPRGHLLRHPPPGALAGSVAAAAGAAGAVERYRAALSVDLLPEMAAGSEQCLRALEAAAHGRSTS